MAQIEPSLEILHAKYGDSDDETLVTIEGTVPDAAAPLLGDTASDDFSDDEDEEDWDDEDDLAAALEWADMREDLVARGNTPSNLGLRAGLQQPNAQNRRGGRHPNSSAGNMGRLNAHFYGGTVRVLDDLEDKLGNKVSVSGSVANSLKNPVNSGRSRDRADRATVEQVLDPRTRMVLFKMLNRGVFSEINGCISTGKEANVYHATSRCTVTSVEETVEEHTPEVAIKVYKTAILVFKDRERYVVGDSRFQRYCKSNPRKMVKLWAEKEMRNLARLRAGGIPAPKPIQLRMHILVMEFLGESGVAAPRLKDANLPMTRLRQAYAEIVMIVRNLYQKCRLVHADLSEYNILVHQGQLFIIDVSQSVELDHPRAFDFLREDVSHVNDYFRRQSIPVLTNRELFDFAVDPGLPLDGPDVDAEMERLMKVAAERPIGFKMTAEQEVAERVWHQAYIPRKLDEVVFYERDHARLQEGKDTEGIYYQALAGMKEDMSGAKIGEVTPEQSTPKSTGEASDMTAQTTKKKKVHWAPGTTGGSDYSNSSEGDGSSADEDEEGEPIWEERPKMTKDEIKAARKEHKKNVKEANAEKRKTKTPKHVKRKAEKIGKKKK